MKIYYDKLNDKLLLVFQVYGQVTLAENMFEYQFIGLGVQHAEGPVVIFSSDAFDSDNFAVIGFL